MINEILHAIDRALIHIFSASGCMMAVYFVISLLARKRKDCSFIPKMLSWQLFFAALIVLIAAIVREPFDVANGGPAWKSYTDMASWAIGLTFGFIGIKKLVIMDWR
jgi:hypothetical protein